MERNTKYGGSAGKKFGVEFPPIGRILVFFSLIVCGGVYMKREDIKSRLRVGFGGKREVVSG